MVQDQHGGVRVVDGTGDVVFSTGRADFRFDELTDEIPADQVWSAPGGKGGGPRGCWRSLPAGR